MTDWTKDPAMIEAMAKALHDASPFDDDKPEDYLPEAQAAASVLPDFAVPKVDMAGLDGLIERLMEPADWAIERPLMELRTEAATQLQALAARVKVLEAENERLREALWEVSILWRRHKYSGDFDLWLTAHIRAALKGTEQ